MTRRIAIAAIATVCGVGAAIAFSELTGSDSAAGAALFFGLGLGGPVAYLLASLAMRRWSEGAVAVGLAFVSFTWMVLYVSTTFSRGMEGW